MGLTLRRASSTINPTVDLASEILVGEVYAALRKAINDAYEAGNAKSEDEIRARIYMAIGFGEDGTETILGLAPSQIRVALRRLGPKSFNTHEHLVEA